MNAGKDPFTGHHSHLHGITPRALVNIQLPADDTLIIIIVKYR